MVRPLNEVIFWLVKMLLCTSCFSQSLAMEAPPKANRPSATSEAMPVPGCVVISIPEERTSIDSRASRLSDIPTNEILQEAIERLAEIAVEQQVTRETLVLEPVIGSICLRSFLQCHKMLRQVKPCATALIFIGGVSTIVADAIVYAGGADTQTAGYVALSAMAAMIVLTSLYLGCKLYYRNSLPDL